MPEQTLNFENYAHGLIENGESLLQPIHVEQAKQHGYIITSEKSFIRKLQPYAAIDLAKMNLKPPPFIVTGLLPAGLTVLAAPPKAGKSWLCLDICCAVAEGKPFWGCSASQGDALYLDLESREWRIDGRFKAMHRAIPEQLFISHEAASLDAGLLAQLHSWVNEATNPRIIVIDTIGRVKNGARRGENCYEADSRMYAPLQKFATERGLSIIAVTHLRKSNGLSVDDPFESIMGSNGLFAIADAAWMIKGRRAEEEKAFLATGRDFDHVENTIAFNRDLCRWEMLGNCEALTEAREKVAYDTSLLVITIKQMLKESDGRLQTTAADLFFEIEQRTGEYPSETPAILGKLLRKFAPQLQRYDKITYTPAGTGGRNGRLHVFTNKTSIP